MGVTGAGKTTVGSLLAGQLGCDFLDADDFHPPANVAKMHQGIPLTDKDRLPWLKRLNAEIRTRAEAGRNLVLACSALKNEYRKMLEIGAALKFVYLKGSRQEIIKRLKARHGHFADEKILAGQFADLQEPGDALVVNIGRDPEEIVEEIRRGLNV